MNFLGRKLRGSFEGVSDLSSLVCRMEGSRIKHRVKENWLNLEALAVVDDPTNAQRDLDRITTRKKGRGWPCLRRSQSVGPPSGRVRRQSHCEHRMAPNLGETGRACNRVEQGMTYAAACLPESGKPPAEEWRVRPSP